MENETDTDTLNQPAESTPASPSPKGNAIVITFLILLTVGLALSGWFQWQALEEIRKSQEVAKHLAETQENFITRMETLGEDFNVRVENLERVMERGLGKDISISLPPTFEVRIQNIEVLLKGDLGLGEISALEDDFNDLLRGTPKWVLDEAYNRLETLSALIQLTHLVIQAGETMTSDDVGLLEATLDMQWPVLPDAQRERFSGLLAGIQQNHIESLNTRVVNLSLQFDELVSRSAPDIELYEELLRDLEEMEEVSAAESLSGRIKKRIARLQIGAEIESLKSMAANLPADNPEEKLSIVMEISAQLVSLYPVVAAIDDAELQGLYEEASQFLGSESNILNVEISANLNRLVNRYNAWALKQLEKYDSRFKKKLEELSKLNYLKDSYDPEKTKDEIYQLSKDWLFVIDKNLLLEPVAEIYNQTYLKTVQTLDSSKYLLKLAKASASTERKTLDEIGDNL